MARDVFFLDFTTAMVRYLKVRTVLVLRSVSKTIDNFILDAHPQDFRLGRQDVFKHLSSFTTESQAIWVLRQLQYWEKLVAYMPILRVMRRRKKRQRQERGASAIFKEMFDIFCSRQHQTYLLNTAIKFDSVRLLRMIAIEVHTHNQLLCAVIPKKKKIVYTRRMHYIAGPTFDEGSS
jgi:hypothetical protein